MTQRNLNKERLFLSFLIFALLIGGIVAATVVGPNGIYDTDYLNGTTLYAQNIFIGSNNVTASILAGGGSGWDGTGALFQNATRELTDNWDAGAYNITADNFTANDIYLISVGNLTEYIDTSSFSSITHVVTTASDLETLVENLENGTYHIMANWDGSSTASIELPTTASGMDITIQGIGMDKTILQGRNNEETINSTKTAWAAGTNVLRLKDITINATSEMNLRAGFWHTQVDNVEFIINMDNGQQAIRIGGSGADGYPSTWKDWNIDHRAGVTSNNIMRIWLENFISIGANIVLKSSVEVGYIFELMGTQAVFYKTNLHQWGLRNITGAIWHVNGNGFYGTIDTVYMAESGSEESIINAVVRIDVGDNSSLMVTGEHHYSEDDMITQLYYDDWTGEHTNWQGHMTGGYHYDSYNYLPPPPSITVTLFDRTTSTTTWTAPGALWIAYSSFNNMTLPLTGYTKCMIFGAAQGTSAGGNQGLSVWDNTNEVLLCAYEWSGNTYVEFYNSSIIQTTVGDISISFAGYQDNGNNILLYDVYAVLW